MDAVDAGDSLADLVARACERMDREMCVRAFMCKPYDDLATYEILGSSLERCFELLPFRACGLEAAAERGTASIDVDRLEECLAVEEGIPVCEEPGFDACVASAVTGLGEHGDVCFSDLECVDECVERDNPEGGDACPTSVGRCGLPREGEPCYSRCAEGLACDGTCKPATPVGETCQGNSCEYPAYCGSVAPERDECITPRELGEACVLDEAFETLAHCVEGYCDAVSGRCVRRKQPGDACEAHEQCRYVGSCPDSGVCPGIATHGEACSSSVLCTPGTQCVGGVCILQGASNLGMPCESFGECHSHRTICVDGVCVNEVFGLEGEYCIDGVCDHLRHRGEVCSTSLECRSRFCDEGVCKEAWQLSSCW